MVHQVHQVHQGLMHKYSFLWWLPADKRGAYFEKRRSRSGERRAYFPMGKHFFGKATVKKWGCRLILH